MKKSKFVADLIRQCSRVGNDTSLLYHACLVLFFIGRLFLVGELRTAIEAGVMSESDVYAEIGDVVNGTKPGRTGDELIVVDLTGTGNKSCYGHELDLL